MPSVCRCLITVALLLQTSCVGQQIKITSEPYAVNNVQALQQVLWRTPEGTSVYCVADQGVSQLRFTCPDCIMMPLGPNGQPLMQNGSMPMGFQQQLPAGQQQQLQQPNTFSANQQQQQFNPNTQGQIGAQQQPLGFGQPNQPQQQQQQQFAAQPQVGVMQPTNQLNPQFQQQQYQQIDWTQEFQKRTEDQSLRAGFPAIRLVQPKVDPFLNGKTLRCEGTLTGAHPGQFANGNIPQGGIQQPNQFQQQPNNFQPQLQPQLQQQLQPGQQQPQQFGPNGQPLMASMAPNTVHADARIVVTYLKNPRIVNQFGMGPVFTPTGGNRFYVRPGDSLTLTCASDANPPATLYKWTKDGAQFAVGATVQVSLQTLGGSSLVCKANNGLYDGDGLDSAQVKVDMWDTPKILTNNYQNPPGLADGKVKLDGTVTLECIASGNPEPLIYWRQNVGNQFWPAVCNEGVNTVVQRQPPTAGASQFGAAPQVPQGGFQGDQNFQGGQQKQQQQFSTNQQPSQFGPQGGQFQAGQQGQQQFQPQQQQPGGFQPQQQQGGVPAIGVPTYMVQARCTVRFVDYTQSGNYYCMACNQVAEGQLECQPNNQTAAAIRATIAVTGAPREIVEPTLQTPMEKGADGQVLNPTQVTVRARYCAEPAPTETYWSVDGKDIPTTQKLDHYQAMQPTVNQTFPNCYDAVLLIDPVSESDRNRKFVFNAVNRDGRVAVTRMINVGNSDHTLSYGASLGLGLGLALGLLSLVLILCVGFCWWRRMMCFSGQKRVPPPGKKDRFNSNIAPGTRAVQAAPTPAKIPINDSFGNGSTHSEKSSDINGVNPVRGSHEGLTYAELDLVNSQPGANRSNGNFQSDYRPTVDYARLQQQSYQQQMKPTTNSVV